PETHTFVDMYVSYTFAVFFLLMLPPPPRPTLFPYTTLFRSHHAVLWQGAARVPRAHRGLLGQEPARCLQREGALTSGIPVCHRIDRKSTRLNSSHVSISYAVFCLKKKTSYPSLLHIIWECMS